MGMWPFVGTHKNRSFWAQCRRAGASLWQNIRSPVEYPRKAAGLNKGPRGCRMRDAAPGMGEESIQRVKSKLKCSATKKKTEAML